MDAAAPADASSDAPASDVTWPMRQVGQGTLIHFPVPEQLARTGVPVFAQVRSSAPIDHVSLFYRGVGARRFTELRMLPMGQQFRMPNGYGALIPCDDIFPPRVEYYVQSIDSSGAPNGNAGTEAQPVQIPIVERRSHPAPVLPGQEPPRTCGGMTGPSAVRDAGGPAAPGARLGRPRRALPDQQRLPPRAALRRDALLRVRVAQLKPRAAAAVGACQIGTAPRRRRGAGCQVGSMVHGACLPSARRIPARAGGGTRAAIGSRRSNA